MYFSNLGYMLLTAAMAIAGAKASPSFNSLLARDLSGSYCDAFVYGAKDTAYGQVCVSISGNSLIVKYPDLPSGDSYTDLHVTVSTSAITEPNQGKWPYTLDKKYCTTSGGSATCTIPIQSTWRACNLQLYIGVHASFSIYGQGNTGWGQGTCIESRPNCPKYFTFTTECKCPVVTTYAPYTTSLIYIKTVYETHTVSCSTTPAPVTATATCTNPNPGATQTVEGTTQLTDFACQTPVEKL